MTKQKVIITDSPPSLDKLYYECSTFIRLKNLRFRSENILSPESHFLEYQTLHKSHPHFRINQIAEIGKDFSQVFSIFDVQKALAYRVKNYQQITNSQKTEKILEPPESKVANLIFLFD